MTARNIKRAKSARARKKTRKAGEKRPRAPIERESARRLIRLGGTQPQLKDVPRRKGTSLPSLEKFRRSIKVRGTPSARLLREERDSDFHDTADKRYARIVSTGEAIPWPEMRAYLKERKKRLRRLLLEGAASRPAGKADGRKYARLREAARRYVRHAEDAYLAGVTPEKLELLDWAIAKAQWDLKAMAKRLDATNRRLSALFAKLDRLEKRRGGRGAKPSASGTVARV